MAISNQASHRGRLLRVARTLRHRRPTCRPRS